MMSERPDPDTDPNTLADALDAWADADEANARNYSFVSTASTLSERAPDLRTAARLLRETAGTADRLAAQINEVNRIEPLMTEMRDRAWKAEARLAALTDAIGNPDELRAIAYADCEHCCRDYLRRIAAAAVTAPDTKEPT